MKADVQVVGRGDGPDREVGLNIVLPADLVEYIADGGDMEGRSALLLMDREQALVLAHELRQAAA